MPTSRIVKIQNNSFGILAVLPAKPLAQPLTSFLGFRLVPVPLSSYKTFLTALYIPLRTVPTIVSVHTFCTSRKTWFKRALGLTLMQSTTLLYEAKFSYCHQIKFNEPVLKPGSPE